MKIVVLEGSPNKNGMSAQLKSLASSLKAPVTLLP